MKGAYLAFDTTGASCAVALACDGKVMASRFEAMSRGQSERLIPLVEEVMKEAGLEYSDLEGLAVTTGPGGFTGVRIGLAAARGMALALDIPVVGVSAFDVLAHALSGADALSSSDSRESRLLIVLDAKRDDLFAQSFDLDGRALADPMAVNPSKLARILEGQSLFVAGNALDQVLDDLEDASCSCSVLEQGERISGEMILACVQEQGLFGKPVGSAALQPLYLRPPDVSLPAKKQPPREENPK
ncbi:tRNA (adenosine(37)-N6)-threonylcarbamoyltransferase complex dimerization subunit type 1 TsaB [Kiloniella sp. b19]|uniref:tRNA (adenosine(37)-N6)-threonylcarbamoyltransferase complex dimerization subunit type 1 TsaB n=1 Tax=Kiloniella sp. GXU_MW_B19 TaxID=3141326 RepID=UPI0031CED20A